MGDGKSGTDGQLARLSTRQPSRSTFQLLSPKPFQPQSLHWFRAASTARWSTSLSLTLAAALTLLGLLIYAMVAVRPNLGHGAYPSIWSIDFHTTTPYNLITAWALPLTGPRALLSTVLISNTPQTLLSLLHLAHTSLLAALAAFRECAAHAARPRSLRVSDPARGSAQRSSYFLALPYRLSVPFAALSTLAHWLLSQAFWMVRIDAQDARGNALDADWRFSITTCAFSPKALVAAIAGVVALSAFVVGVGARRVGGDARGMPVGGTCSAVVAAACHGPEGTRAEELLMWGEVVGVGEEGEEEEEEEGVGRCGFGNVGRVQRPLVGRLYA